MNNKKNQQENSSIGGFDSPVSDLADARKGKPDKEDPINQGIPCECGKKDCKMGLIISKFPEDKIKIQVFDNEMIMTVAVSKDKLIEKLK